MPQGGAFSDGRLVHYPMAGSKNGSYLTWYSLYGTRGFVESGRDPTEEGLEDDLRVGLIVHRDHVGMIGSKGREGPGILDATTGTPTRTIHAGQ